MTVEPPVTSASSRAVRLIRASSESSIDDLGSLYPEQAQPTHDLAAAIETSLRVGLDPSLCAEESTITVPPGTIVVYCYYVKNIGTETLIAHTVIDSQLGKVLPLTPFELIPEKPILFTVTQPVYETTTHLASWTSLLEGTDIDDKLDAGNSVNSTGSATVYVPTFVFTATVGTKKDECATTTSIDVEFGTPVYYCYTAQNTSNIPISLGSLTGANTRSIFQEPTSHRLDPGEKIITYGPNANITDIISIEDTDKAEQSLIEQLKWQAEAVDISVKSEAIAEVQVNVARIEVKTQVGLTTAECQPGPINVDIIIGPSPVEPVQVVYCYFLTNNGQLTLNDHRVEDSQVGTLLKDRTEPVAPGVTINFNITKTIFDANTPLPLSDVLTSTITWRLSNGDTFALSAQDTVTVSLSITDLLPERLFLPLVQR